MKTVGVVAGSLMLVARITLQRRQDPQQIKIIISYHMSYRSNLPVGAIRTSNVIQGGRTVAPVTTGATYVSGAHYQTGNISNSLAHGALTGNAFSPVSAPISSGTVLAGHRAIGTAGLTTGYTTTGVATTGLVQPAPIYNKAVIQQIPTESRIEYVPYQKREIIYQQVERVEQIPIQRVITEYDEVVRSERVPIQRVIQDYYAVEYQVEYIPNVIQETVVDYVAQDIITERVQYVPIETQIVHYPEAEVATAGAYVNRGVVSGVVPTGVVTTGVVPTGVVTTGVLPSTAIYGGGVNAVRTSQYATTIPAATTTYVTQTTPGVASVAALSSNYGNSYALGAGGYNGSLATRSVAAYGTSSLGGSYTVGSPATYSVEAPLTTYIHDAPLVGTSGHFAATLPAQTTTTTTHRY